MEVTSSEFDATIILLPASAVTLNGQSQATDAVWSQGIVQTTRSAGVGDNDTAGKGNPFLVAAIPQAGDWWVAITSKVADTGSFTLYRRPGPDLFVTNALVQYDYDYYADGSLESVTDSSSVVEYTACTMAYLYDELGRMTQVTQTGLGATEFRANFDYNDAGQFTSIRRYANIDGTCLVAQTDYVQPDNSPGYDGMGRLVAMRHTFGTTTRSYSYTFDAASRITQMVSPDGTSNYSDYDATDQLRSADYTYTTADESYTYDDSGNRDAANGSTYATDPGNRLVSDGTYTYTYDNEGNRRTRTLISDGSVTDYAWDQRNRLTKVNCFATHADYLAGTTTSTVEYTYDDVDRRIEQEGGQQRVGLRRGGLLLQRLPGRPRRLGGSRSERACGPWDERERPAQGPARHVRPGSRSDPSDRPCIQRRLLRALGPGGP